MIFFSHHYSISNKKSFGFIVTFLISSIILLLSFSSTLKQINSVTFEKGGDGLQSYYNSVYHIKYDTCQSVCGGMNYPYGEHMLYTNGHIPFVFIIKIVSNNIIDISNYSIGILNVLMLVSFVIASLFLYLIFRHLKIDDWFAIPIAVGIAFLSPQIDRLLGHYCLAYSFVIPGIIYALLKFHERQTYTKSCLIALYILFVGTTHPYHFIATLPLVAAYLGVMMLLHFKNRKQLITLVLHFIIQICIPYALTVLWERFTYHVTDRTAAPWGFFDYYSAWEGIFTSGYSVDKIFTSIFPTGGASWEGMAFIGHFAVIFYFLLFSVFAIIPFLLTKQLFWFVAIVPIVLFILYLKKRDWFFKIFKPTSNIVINILLWTSFFLLILSFCIPFKAFPEIVKHLGPFRQFRALGRLSWAFFYIVNIAAFYLLFNILSRFTKIKYLVASLAIIILFVNVYYRLNGFSERLNNPNPIICDFDNNLPTNQWMKNFDASKYQAILPIPMYHCGSENFWVDWSKCSIIDLTLPISLKTGLPVTGAYLGRTSMQQTVNILQFAQEPYAYPTLLKDLHSAKPFLLIAAKCDKLNASEQEIVAHASKITETDFYGVYQINPSYFAERITQNLIKIKSEYRQTPDSNNVFITKTFDAVTASRAYKGKGAYEFTANTYTTIFETEVTTSDSAQFLLSFWFYGSKLDLYPQATTVIINKSLNNAPAVEDYLGLHRNMVLFDGDWFLTEYPISVAAGTTKIKIILINQGLKPKANLIVDELQWRPANTDYWQKRDSSIVKNNRFYQIQ